MGKRYEKSMHSKICGLAKSEEKDVKPPKYHCSTCTKCNKNWCSFFNRHIEKDFNRCFYHSNYSPILASFKPQENLELLVEKEQEKRYA